MMAIERWWWVWIGSVKKEREGAWICNPIGDAKKNRRLITRWNGCRFLHCQTTLLTNISTIESIYGFADGTV